VVDVCNEKIREIESLIYELMELNPKELESRLNRIIDKHLGEVTQAQTKTDYTSNIVLIQRFICSNYDSESVKEYLEASKRILEKTRDWYSKT